MKKQKKVFLSFICALLLVATSVLGTIAYLMDTSTVTNTFTVGNVDITLDEAEVDENGKTKKDGDGNVIRNPEGTGNEYHLLPGQVYDKDPTITVKAESENSYVRMMMTVHNASAVQDIIDHLRVVRGDLTIDYADLFDGWDEEAWIYHGYTEEDNTITFEFRYKDIVNGIDENGDSADQILPPLFTAIVVPGEVTNEQLKELNNSDDPFKITVEGHAIQAVGFEAEGELTVEDIAWEAFDKQANTTE